jgi:hypothetical protein
MVKRCVYCGRYFTPDYRIKERQKSCNSVSCRKARKRTAQKAWCQKNPDYFAGHYETYVKPWRQRMIKDEIPPSKALEKLIIFIPGDGLGMIKDEITVKRIGVRTFAAHGYG